MDARFPFADAASTRRGFVWLRRGAGGLAWCCLGLATVWAVVALYVDVRVPWLRVPLATTYALGLLAVWVRARRPWKGIVTAAAFALVLAWWLSLQPSNDRDWQPEVAVPATAVINGDLVTIKNIRNFEYRSETDFTPHYNNKTFDLRELDSVDLVCVYWGSAAIAHVMVSFGFAGDRDHVCISIETRKERGEGYSTIKGFFRQFEIFYVVADERDLIGVRANHRQPPEEVYVFRTRLPRENQQSLFLDYLRTVNSLAEKPVWYNTLTDNCTTGVLLHANAYNRRARYNWRILLSGYAAEYAAGLGMLDITMPFAELRRRALVNDHAHDDKAEGFSRQIRQGIPLPKPLTLEEFRRHP